MLRPSSRHVTPADPPALSRLWGVAFLRPKSHASSHVASEAFKAFGRSTWALPPPAPPRPATPTTATLSGRARGCPLLCPSPPAGPGLDGQAQAQHQPWLLPVRLPELSSATRLSGMGLAQHPETRVGCAIPRQLPEAGQSTCCAHSQPCPPPGPAFTHRQAPEARGLYPTPIPSPRRH